jgi:KDO2-lipid IV(A) lauroyltransferase
MLARLSVFVMWLAHFLPYRAIATLGDWLGLLLYAIAAERRRVGATNLRLCFPEKRAVERQAILICHFKMFGRSLMERGILWWSSPSRINLLIRIEGKEHFDATRDKPAILLMAHFVGLEVAGTWVSMRTDYVDIYSNQKSRYLNDLLLRMRARFGKPLLYSRQDGIRPVLKAVREGHPLCYFMDQDWDIRDSMFVPFFGVAAATLTTLPRMVSMTGAKVVPCITRVLPGKQGYEIRFYPEWHDYPAGEAGLDARRVNAFIEERALEMPEQYFWLHKRFKTRPEGEASFYD